MPFTPQQKQALRYFRGHAKAWAKKVGLVSPDQVNVIRQRNDYVMKVIRERKSTRTASEATGFSPCRGVSPRAVRASGHVRGVANSHVPRTSGLAQPGPLMLLDVGCGPGGLVCAAAKKGITSLGVDFSPEMIKIAQKTAKRAHLKNAEFECRSIFDCRFPSRHFDMICANGFLEYISAQDLRRLLVLSWEALKTGGSLILGSRNRLFNIFSLNSFTEEEIRDGTIGLLLSEAIHIARADHIKRLVGIQTAPLQTEGKRHQDTGIQVSTRYQYTPCQLVNRLKDAGFNPVEVFPIHIHGISPHMKEKHPGLHGNLSNFLRNFAGRDMSLIPQASSFMIHAKKSDRKFSQNRSRHV